MRLSRAPLSTMSKSRRSSTLLPRLLTLLCASSMLVSAEKLESGLEIQNITTVPCDRQTQNGDNIKMHYKGTLESGKVFDSSYERNQPLAFELGAHQVIEGWDQGLLNMCIGDERRLIIPPELAYGDRGIGPIPPKATLIFETKLVAIVGVMDAPIKPVPAAPAPKTEEEKQEEEEEIDYGDPAVQKADEAGFLNPLNDEDGEEDEVPPSSSAPDESECRLLGPFALVVQAGLGLLALLALVWKRWRERPRRPVRIWFFDVSKQVFGSALLHVLNLLMSMLSSGEFEMSRRLKQATSQLHDADGRAPNPCSFYLINLAIDTTIGIPILFVMLRLLHHGAALTPLANPPESIKSGHYGSPPRATWWLKQSIIYFVGLLLMKLCVFFIFQILPWIAWVGDWALRWTEGSEALQITFVMFIFPLAMNAIQYYIIDSFIKEGAHADHEPVPSSDPDGDDNDDSSGSPHSPFRRRQGGDEFSSGRPSMDAEARKREIYDGGDEDDLDELGRFGNGNNSNGSGGPGGRNASVAYAKTYGRSKSGRR